MGQDLMVCGRGPSPQPPKHNKRVSERQLAAFSPEGTDLRTEIEQAINNFEIKLSKVDPSGLGPIELSTPRSPITKQTYTSYELLADLYKIRSRLHEIKRGKNIAGTKLELQQLADKTDYLLKKWELLKEAVPILASLKNLSPQSRELIASDPKAQQAYDTMLQLGAYLWNRDDKEFQEFFQSADYFQRRLLMLSVKREYKSGYNYILMRTIDHNPKFTDPPSPYQKKHHDPAIQKAFHLVVQMGEKIEINPSEREQFQKSAVILGRLLAYISFSKSMEKQFPNLNQYLEASPALRIDLDRIQDLAFMRPRRIFALTERVKWLQDFNAQVENFTKKVWAYKTNIGSQKTLGKAAEDHRRTYPGLVSGKTDATIGKLAQEIKDDSGRATEFNLGKFDPRPTQDLQAELENILTQVREDIEFTNRINLLVTNTMISTAAFLAGGGLGGAAAKAIIGKIGGGLLARGTAQAVNFAIQGTAITAAQRGFNYSVGIPTTTSLPKELLVNSLAAGVGGLPASTLGGIARRTINLGLPIAVNIAADYAINGKSYDPTLDTLAGLGTILLSK